MSTDLHTSSSLIKCLHRNQDGVQCLLNAIEGSSYCTEHGPKMSGTGSGSFQTGFTECEVAPGNEGGNQF